MPTPVRSNILESYLLDYDDHERLFLCSGFKHGFRIPISYNVLPRICRNHPSALDNKEHVTAKIEHELEMNRIVGPFDTLPSNLVCSPLALIPKKETGKFRLIHDLSYPKGDSVNLSITRSIQKLCMIQLILWLKRLRYMVEIVLWLKRI